MTNPILRGIDKPNIKMWIGDVKFHVWLTKDCELRVGDLVFDMRDNTLSRIDMLFSTHRVALMHNHVVEVGVATSALVKVELYNDQDKNPRNLN